jgi:hypothetical protein
VAWLSLFTAPVSLPALPQDEDAENQDLEVELYSPGDPRKHLEVMMGDWSTTVHFWTTPDAEPEISSGTASSTWLLGERFVQTVFSGEIQGQPFEALRIEGFDEAASEFVTTWRDNRGTHTLVFRGQCDSGCRVRTMTAELTDPGSQIELQLKAVTTFIDEDSYTYESYIVTPSGNEFKNLEFVATRRP